METGTFKKTIQIFAHGDLERSYKQACIELEHNPDDLDANLLVGYCLTKLGNHSEAKSILVKLLSRHPNNEVALALYQEITGELPNSYKVGESYDYEVDLSGLLNSEGLDKTVSAESLCIREGYNIFQVEEIGGLKCSLPINVYELKDALLVGARGAILNLQGELIRETSFYTNYRDALIPILWQKMMLKKDALQPGTYLPLCSIWSQSFWHWMLEYLPSVLIAKATGSKFQIIIPDAAPKYVVDSLDILGIDREDIKVMKHTFAWLEKLIIPKRMLGCDGLLEHSEILTNLRNCFLERIEPKTSSSLHSRIFISRRDTITGRRIVNETELLVLLNKYQFSIVELGTMSLKEQVSIMSQCRVVVAPHGAGLVHTLFMPEASTVIELFSPQYVNPCMTAVIKYLRHDYKMLVSSNNGSYEYGNDIYVDLEILEQYLKNCL